MSEPLTDAALTAALHGRFGLPAFRDGQLAALQTLRDRRRLLCVHPTGFGKSLLYQLPASLLGGLTVVISPLLALVRDQQEQLGRRFEIAAAAINSDQDDAQNAAVRQRLAAGALKILFVAPEQLDHVERFAALAALPIDLLVVDEAHCISTWGHDFRPSYRQILRFVNAVAQARPALRLLALTATANLRTAADIVAQLGTTGGEVAVMRRSMSRPNIALSVWPCQGLAAKLTAVAQLVASLPGCGLVYCATRERADVVGRFLAAQGVRARTYHAGLPPEEKQSLQQAFVDDAFKALAATNALGMGIDKGNLRFIVHFDVPGSITAYYQEVGRCGRDGADAHAVLLFDADDLRIQQHFIDGANATEADFAAVLRAVAAAPAPPNITTIRRLSGLHPTRVTVVVAELVEQGMLRKQAQRGAQTYVPGPATGAVDRSRYIAQRRVKLDELAAMRAYAEQRGRCCMALLQEALGDEGAAPCGRCQVCAGTSAAAGGAPAAAELAAAEAWLLRRGVTLLPAKQQRLGAGHALLDGSARSPLFAAFMRQRATAPAPGGGAGDPDGLPAALVEALEAHLAALRQAQPLAAVVALPSRSWLHRAAVMARVGALLEAPCFADVLSWAETPEARQGTLCNNDQRHFNVHGRMRARPGALPPGAVLLLDDYTGSGNTLREAARALRQAGVQQALTPLALAAVRWRQGAAGMV